MDSSYVKVTFFLATIFQWGSLAVEGACYFPQEFQGEFVMQSTANVGNGIQYGPLNVTATSIPIWGNCHKRKENNFILMLNYGETSCIRCLHLKLRSANILQVFTLSKNIISQCYVSVELAEANCPSMESLDIRTTSEILLFKTRDAVGSYTTKEYCPIDGKYFVKYRSNNLKKPNECNYDSTMDSCPSGSTLNFRLHGCSYDNGDIKFECLGTWKGSNNENFLVFTDNRQSHSHKPKYRCALYSQNEKTGEIQMALSRDSTCTTDLINSTSGYETFVLMPKTENPWPAEAAFGICNFPKWMNGNWEHVRVNDDTMVYKDHSSFKTYTIKCVGIQENKDKYLVFSRTQCNEERYNCMRIMKRSNNILEFQLGTNSSVNKDVFELCSDSNFQHESWITQGRTDLELPGFSSGMCPIAGEYVGVIPDSEDLDLCAKLWSDCRAPELMYYQVSHCKTNEIYEEREYRCLGHWRESEFLYTYTQRRDVAAGTYECFVGAMISDNEIYIKEAGEHCQRHMDPLHYGMRLNKTNLFSCISYYSSPPPINIKTSNVGLGKSTISPPSTRKYTTKPWDFNSGMTEGKENISSTSLLKSTYLFIWLLFIKLYL